MSLIKSEKIRDKYHDRSQILLEERKLLRNSTFSNQSKLSELEEKIKFFGGFQQMEEQFIKDLNFNNQRMDNILVSVRTLLKSDPKGRRSGVSPACRNVAQKGIYKDKSNKKLIQRVERAIHQQSPHFSK